MNGPKRIVVVGAGVNGLVAANRLARAGHHVTVVEREKIPGGAARRGIAEMEDGSRIPYPLGATVLGLMQDFVFKETGLSTRLTAGAPEHPNEYRFASDRTPVIMERETGPRAAILRDRWGETGDLRAYEEDASKVIAFLQAGYRSGQAPSLEAATAALGSDMVRRWITGSAHDLLDHYLTAGKTKVVYGKDLMESGPISFREPWSALTISLTDSGSVFGGRWGYVRGGIFTLVETLADIDRELGVDVRLGHEVREIDLAAGHLRFWLADPGLAFDHVVFASDPLTAATLIEDADLERRISGKRLLGTSGKLVALFREPVRWKDDTGRKDYAAALKFILQQESPDELDAASSAAVQGAAGFVPGYFEIYGHGAGNRMLGQDDGRDAVMVFFKHLNDALPGEEMDETRRYVQQLLLSRMANPEALAWSRLLTPHDLTLEFGFPRGNIDHVAICGGQTFMARTYADHPAKGFYRFGRHPNVWYCGAGAYPCGSVTGTAAWMCVEEMLRIGL